MPTVDNLYIQIAASTDKASKSLDVLIKKLDKVQSALSSTGLKTDNLKIDNSTVKNFAKLRTEFSASNKSMETLKINTGSLVSGFQRLATRFISVTALAKGLSTSIEKASDSLESFNYWQNALEVVAGKAVSEWENAGYESAEAYYNSFTERASDFMGKMSGFTPDSSGMLVSTGKKSLGIDPTTLMQQQATFAQMSSSMGIASERSLKLSNALTAIGADLASIKNMNFDAVWNNMASGIVGMSRAWDKYGVNIRNVNLQQKLNELGINANIQALNQQDKALLRGIILLENTRYAWGDLAETLNTPANQFRLLSANISNLSRIIGNLFMPVVAKVLPIINGFVIALQRLFTWIGKLAGIDLSGITSGFGGGGADFSGISDVLDDADNSIASGASNAEKESNALKDAAKNAKKLRDYTLGIDELNIIKPEDTEIDYTEDTEGSGGLDGLGALGDLSGIGAAFDALYDEYMKAWEEAFANMENDAIAFADRLTAIAKYIGTNFKIGFDTAYTTDKGAELIAELQSIYSRVQGIFQDENVSQAMERMISSSIQALGALAGSVTSIGTSIGYGVAAGVDTALEESEEYIKDKTVSIANNVTSLNEKITEFATGLSVIGTAFESQGFQDIITFFTKLGTLVGGELVDNITGVASDLFGFFTKPISGNADKWKDLLENIFELASNLLTPFEEIVDYLMSNSSAYEDSFLHYLLEGLTELSTLGVGGVLDLINSGLENLIAATEGFNLENITTAFTDLGDNISGIFEKISEWFSSNLIEPIVSKATLLKDKITSIWESINTTFTNIIEPIANLFSGLASRIGAVFEGAWLIIQAVWTIATDWFLTTVIEPIANAFTAAWNTVKSVWVFASTWFTETIWNPLVEGFTGLYDKVTNIVSALWEGIKTTFSTVMQWFDINVITPLKGAWETATTAIAGFFTTLWSSIKSGVVGAMNAVIGGIESAINFIVDGINTLVEGFNKVAEWGANVVGSDWGGVELVPNVTLPRINAFYNGGYVPTSYSMFMAGENGVPELLGTVGGRTAVAGGAEITGIREEIRSTGEAETTLLRTAVELLQVIAAKDPNTYLDSRELLSGLNERNLRNGYSF